MRKIAWLSEKGGSGKTTSAVNTAVCLAKQGKRVLFIDADPQGNASLVFLKGGEAEEPNLYHVLTGTADATDTIRKTEIRGLDLLAADSKLADANVLLASEAGRERRLLLAMRGLESLYDFVIVDTSPQRTLINANVLNYVTEVLCPVEPSIFSLAGIVKLQGAVGQVVKFLDNQELKLAGLIVTRATHENISRDVESQLRATFGALVYQTTIPQNVKVVEAHSRFLSVLEYAPHSPALRLIRLLPGRFSIMARKTGSPEESASKVFSRMPGDDGSDAPPDESGSDSTQDGQGETSPESRPAASSKRRTSRRAAAAAKTKPRSLHLPEDLHELLWLQARRKKSTVSAVATDILRRGLPKLRIESDEPAKAG